MRKILHTGETLESTISIDIPLPATGFAYFYKRTLRIKVVAISGGKKDRSVELEVEPDPPTAFVERVAIETIAHHDRTETRRT